jgi:monofunctional biosynthetic peptidoglycan transglycosylase
MKLPVRINLFKGKALPSGPENPKISKFSGFKRILFFSAICFLLFILVFFALVYFSLPDVSGLKTKNPVSTAFMDFRKAEAGRGGKKLGIRQEWIAFDRIPGLLKQAVRLSEDADFYGHDGIDYHELQESIKKDFQQGKKARGGSTITMQLAKNLYLSPKKSYIRKIKEFFIAKRLEHTLSKNRIFHLYLNTVELGRGIFGFQAAARFFFGKSVEDLNLVEIIRLVAVMPKPLRLDPRSNSGYLKWRVRLIAGRLNRVQVITTDVYEEILREFL